MQQGIKGGIKSLKRSLRRGFVSMAVPSGQVEKVGMCLVKREFDGVVLYPSGPGDKVERFEACSNGL